MLAPQRPVELIAMTPDAWPSSAGFDLIADALKDDAQKQDAIKKGGNIFAFTLKNDQGKEESWHIDLKETGTVGKGLAPKGKKPGVTLVLSDVEFAKLISGKANAQNMFMQGKLKIKGNMMAATKLGPILEKAQSKAKL
ncbi:hypothetical protein D0859_07545 [Hortaea werneckii]|uniref:SCP2 domain-containing protein n=2 Tax=Hortaea werneckii TaxID=91943 RepID=A0A3M7IS35_HORWE|nr:hypothetical protein D0859_07545 [Hortaea werneckii]